MRLSFPPELPLKLVSRRSFLRFAMLGSAGSLLGACAPAPPASPTVRPTSPPTQPATPTAAPAVRPTVAPTAVPTAAAKPTAAVKEAWQQWWNDTLVAARREGVVTVAGPPGDLYRAALATSFESAHPDVRIEYQGTSGRDFGPKILAERDAGQFLLDVHVGGPSTGLTLKQRGAFAPLPAALIQPDLSAEGTWLFGFRSGFQDREAQFIYGFEGILRPSFYVNRDIVPENELSAIRQLLDPKWKGKIGWNDPRTFGAGSAASTYLMMVLGEDFLNQIYALNVVPTRDLRQLAEWIVRGTYPIAVGLDTTFLGPFQEQGLGKNVQPLERDSQAGARMEIGFGCASLMDRAPHSAAAQVYLNWLLSKDGQTAWVEKTTRNSRRRDVAGPQETALDPSKTYLNVNNEENQAATNRSVEIATKLLT